MHGLILSGAGLAFALDVTLSGALAGHLGYVVPILLSFWLPRSRATLAVAVLLSLQVLLAGLFLDIEGAWLIATRIEALVLIWVVALAAIARKGVERRWRKLALMDPLCGVANRRSFLTQLARELRLATRHGHTLTVCVCDLDDFKRINDAHGHARGDELLVEFARLAGSVCRSTDIVGRLGGDEFCFLLPHTGAIEAVRAMDRLRVRWALANRALGTTVTFGVIEACGDETPTQLVQAADLVLYEGKRGGRNRVAVRAAGAGTRAEAG